MKTNERNRWRIYSPHSIGIQQLRSKVTKQFKHH